jgi:regulator of RNase E activity RraA
MAEKESPKRTVVGKTLAAMNTVANYAGTFIGGAAREIDEVGNLQLGRPGLAFILITMASQAITNNVNISVPAAGISVLVAEATVSISQTIRNRREK